MQFGEVDGQLQPTETRIVCAANIFNVTKQQVVATWVLANYSTAHFISIYSLQLAAHCPLLIAVCSKPKSIVYSTNMRTINQVNLCHKHFNIFTASNQATNSPADRADSQTDSRIGEQANQIRHHNSARVLMYLSYCELLPAFSLFPSLSLSLIRCFIAHTAAEVRVWSLAQLTIWIAFTIRSAAEVLCVVVFVTIVFVFVK